MIKRFIMLLLAFGLGAAGCQNPQPSTTNKKPTAIQQNEDSGPQADRRNRIVFFGNSLTAAYGIDPKDGFVHLIQQRIDSLGLPYRTVNAGISGETSAGGKDRIDWILKDSLSVFFLELGGNDGLRGIAPEATYQNLKFILQAVRDQYPEAHLLLAGMQAPPNMGDRFTEAFRSVYPRLEQEFDLVRIPFLLEGVAGEPDLNLPDGIHPNEEGQRIITQTIWDYLYPLISEGKESPHEVQ